MYDVIEYFLAAPRFPSSLLTTLELVEGTSQQINFSAHANPTPVQYTWQTEDGSDVVFADGISVEAVSINKWFIVENQSCSVWLFYCFRKVHYLI